MTYYAHYYWPKYDCHNHRFVPIHTRKVINAPNAKAARKLARGYVELFGSLKGMFNATQNRGIYV